MSCGVGGAGRGGGYCGCLRERRDRGSAGQAGGRDRSRAGGGGGRATTATRVRWPRPYFAAFCGSLRPTAQLAVPHAARPDHAQSGRCDKAGGGGGAERSPPLRALVAACCGSASSVRTTPPPPLSLPLSASSSDGSGTRVRAGCPCWCPRASCHHVRSGDRGGGGACVWGEGGASSGGSAGSTSLPLSLSGGSAGPEAGRRGLPARAPRGHVTAGGGPRRGVPVGVPETPAGAFTKLPPRRGTRRAGGTRQTPTRITPPPPYPSR